MSERRKLITYASLDLLDQRVTTAANFAEVCGVDVGEAADIPTFFGILRGRLSVSGRGGIDTARKAILAGAAHGEGGLTIVGDDSLERYVECVWSVERNGHGQATRVFVSGVDAGAARRADDALHDLEARHRSALKAGLLGSWETDLGAGTRLWTLEGMALFGIDLPDGRGHVGGLGDEYLSAIHPDDRHLAQRYYAQADEQDSFAAEYRIVRPDGAIMWLAGRGLVLSRDKQGKALRLVSIMADVSERRAAEEDLRMERERLTLALGAGRMGAFDLDIDTDVLWWSPKMYEVFGVSPDAFVPTRQSVAELIHPEDFEEFARRRSEAMANGHPFELEARIIRPDGKAAWVGHRGQSTYDSSGKPRRSFGVTVDITERKLAEQALRDADRKKDDFIATLAHELRNPLAPIRNAITLLRRNARNSDSEGLRHREVIFRQVAQMSRLLDDLLDVSRISRRQVQLRCEWIQLNALFDEVTELAQPSLDAAGHKLHVRLPVEPLELFGDGLRLAQVLSNLLINAVKYTPPGGHIVLEGGLEGKEVLLCVRDNGIGLTTEQLPRIFEMFGQVSDSIDRSQGGLGIGLALARGLVELHGGRIDVSSEGADKGSSFSVRLPRTPRGDDTGASASAVPDASPPGPAAASSLRILVADDLADTADTLAEILECIGHDVRVAYDGEEALRLAETFVPDVAVVDLGMPGLSGYEVAREIRSREWGRVMTLICQTGWGQEDDRRRAREAGFDHHLVKPVDVDELVGLLRRRVPD